LDALKGRKPYTIKWTSGRGNTPKR
jgi:hypothetical protein